VTSNGTAHAMPYGGDVHPLAVIRRPRSGFDAEAAAPRVVGGLAAVVVTGLVSLVTGAAANALVSGGPSGLVVALLLPALFVAYWLLQAWLVDAAAAMVGRSRNRRAYLAVSGYAFPPLAVYGVLSLAEALLLHVGGGAGPPAASAVAWLTLPVLAWFIVLSVLAIQAVYDLPALNALAFALLPIAALTAALLIVSLALGALHTASVI
jgi:Yip1 domain